MSREQIEERLQLVLKRDAPQSSLLVFLPLSELPTLRPHDDYDIPPFRKEFLFLFPVMCFSLEKFLLFKENELLPDLAAKLTICLEII